MVLLQISPHQKLQDSTQTQTSSTLKLTELFRFLLISRSLVGVLTVLTNARFLSTRIIHTHLLALALLLMLSIQVSTARILISLGVSSPDSQQSLTVTVSKTAMATELTYRESWPAQSTGLQSLHQLCQFEFLGVAARELCQVLSLV